jgi:hypothetical protein
MEEMEMVVLVVAQAEEMEQEAVLDQDQEVSIGNHTLAGRSMISKPSLINASRALGRIMIKVSVDKNGNVFNSGFRFTRVYNK